MKKTFVRALLASTILTATAVVGVPKANATVNSSQVSTQAVGNGVTTAFTYPFVIPYQADGVTPAVTVTLTTGGVTTTLPSTSYQITGVGNPAGGTVKYPLVGSPLTASTTITITRSLNYIQPTAVANTGFYPHTVETVADNLAMQIQQLAAGGGGGGGGGAGVSSFNSRTGAVVLQSGDVTSAIGYTPANRAGDTFTGKVNFAPASAANAGINTGVGATPLSPTNGDLWSDNTGVYARVNGTTVQLAAAGASGVTSFNARTGVVTLNGTDVTTALGYTPVSKAGDTMTGPLTLPAGTTGAAPLNIPQGSAPSSPTNGDLWTTTTGVFARINGNTQQLASASGAVTSFNSRTGAVSLLSSDVTDALGFSPVQSFNTRTGVVTLNSTDVTTALTYTPLKASNIIAGTNVTLGVAGNDITINAASAGGTQNVTYFANVSGLRANSSSTIPNAILQNYTSVGDSGGGSFYIDAADTTSADNNCTIFVDAGMNRWKRVNAAGGPLDVRWCGAKGDGATNDAAAIGYALAASKSVFIAPSPNCYIVGSSLTINPNQAVFGANSEYTSCIKASTANQPVFVAPVTVGPSYYTNQNMTIAYLTIDRSVTATAGGDGIFFASYVNNVNLQNLVVKNQWIGLNLRSTDSSNINDSFITSNFSHGVYITGNSYYGTFQWSLRDVFSTQNGNPTNTADGFRFETAAGTAGASVGSLTNLRTFANTGRGASFLGGSGRPLQGARIEGGFFGQDGDNEIYLDTYQTGGAGHVIKPTYVELAGTFTTGRGLAKPASNIGAGIYITANNELVTVQCGTCFGNSYDGLFTSGKMTNIVGGSYVNNGLASNAISLGRANGIYVFNAVEGAVITGVRSGNTQGASGSQNYGIASNVDNIAVSGCDLRGFKSPGGSYTAFSGPTSNIVVSGCLPVAANTGGAGAYLPLSGGTVTGNLTVNGTVTLGNTLSVAGTSAFNDNMTLNGAKVFSAPSGQVNANQVQATAGLYGGGLVVGSPVGGYVANNINVAGGGSFGGALNMQGNNISGVAALGASGDIQTTGGSIYATNGGLIARDLQISRSAGIGSLASGTTGQLNMNGGLFAAGVTSSGVLNVTGTATMGVINGTTITASTDLIASSQIHVNGPAAFTGDINMSGGHSIYNTSGGAQFRDFQIDRSLGVGTVGASGITGRISVSNGIDLNGSVYTNP